MMTMNEMESAIHELQQQVAALQAAPPSTRRESEGVRITKALDQIGVSTRLQGYEMLVRAISIAMNSTGTPVFSKDVYPRIAVALDTEPRYVERTICYAIDATFAHADPEIVQSFFGNAISCKSGKPSNVQFIMSVAKKLKNG